MVQAGLMSREKKNEYQLRSSADLDPLMEKIGNSKFVLLGESTHGTHEYYTWRSVLTQRLIKEKGFSFIAVEGDWPDCYKINRFIKHYEGAGYTAIDVLSKIHRWPTWMWANWETVSLAEWLREYNKHLLPEKRIGFYGLDVYSLWESMEILVNYLKREDAATAEMAIEALSCFEPYREKGELYTHGLRLNTSCRDEVARLLLEGREKAAGYEHDFDAPVNAEINALILKNGEKYYRSMVSFNKQSWNIRDKHMAETLNRLSEFHGPDCKVVIWEHNTHIGDARFTEMKDEGLVNLGQLVREQYTDEETVLVGFGCYEGTVIAGRIWNGRMQKMDVPRALKGSFEHKIHEQSPDNKLLIFNRNDPELISEKWLPHRAIGVVYRPERDPGNYVPSLVSSRYDAFIYFDKTKALHPLQLGPDGNVAPETYPFGV